MINLNIKIFIVVLFAIGSFVAEVRSQETDCSYLVWSDEFDQAGAPSSTNWDYDTGGGGWGNNELQNYTNTRTNSWIENGRLFIKAIKDNGNWTSARLVTRQKGDWLYGRIEVKAKLPTGKGTWPAIWMLPTDWVYGSWPSSGEIDIMEHVGYDPGVVHGTIHTEAYNHSIGTQKGGSITLSDFSTSFHVYAIEWTEDKMDWYVDDQLYFTFNNENKTYKEWPFDKRFHLLLNIAIGGNWGGAQGIDPNLTEAVMEVEYVRIYQNEAPKPVIQGSNAVKEGNEYVFSCEAVSGVSYNWSFPEGVSIKSGDNTNEVIVNWGATSGEVTLFLQSACGSMEADPYSVKLIVEPEGTKYYIPFTDADNVVLWQTNAGVDNSITLSWNDALKVDYSINAPSNNPSIEFEFENLLDLSNYRELALLLKANADNLPSVVRIDLEDINGNVNLNDLFKITTFASTNQYQQYYYAFEDNASDDYQLDKIKSIRVYVNYGIFGKNGTSFIELKDLYLATPGTTSVSNTNVLPSISLFPNPFEEKIYIQGIEKPQSVDIYNLNGKLCQHIQLNNSTSFSFLSSNSGIYFFNITDSFGHVTHHRLIRK